MINSHQRPESPGTMFTLFGGQQKVHTFQKIIECPVQGNKMYKGKTEARELCGIMF